MSLDDLDQFIQEEPTPEPVSAQAEAKAAQDKDKKEKTLPEVPDIEGLAKAFRALSFKWIKGMQEQKVFPSKEELDDYYHTDAGREEPNLMTVLAGGAEYAKQLTERLLAVCAFFETPTVKKYGAGLLDVLKDKGVSQQLMPYVLKQLENEKYSAGSLAELIDPNYLPQRKQSILDLAIAQAKKEQRKEPIPQKIKDLALRDMANIGDFVCSFTAENLAGLFTTRNKALYMVDEKGNKSPLPDDFPLWFFSEVISIGKAKSFFGTYVVYMPKALEDAGFSLDFRKDKSESRGKALSGFIASISKAYSCARVIYDGREFALLNYESRLEDQNYAVFSSPILEYIGTFFSQRKTLPICYTVETKALHIGSKQPLVLEMYMRCMEAIHQRADIPDQQLKQNKGKDLPDKDLRTYRLKVTTLMQDRCPRVWERYSSLGRTTSRNKFLKSKFSALKEKLEQGLSEQYERVSVRFSIPTTSTLSQASIYVFHYGRKQKLTLPPPPKFLGEVE